MSHTSYASYARSLSSAELERELDYGRDSKHPLVEALRAEQAARASKDEG